MTHPNASLIDALNRTIHQRLEPIMPAHGQLALLDFPDYANVGDSAIWLGTIQYLLDRYKIRPCYVSSIEAFSAEELARALPQGPIFLLGGGNFGDLWPRHQEFRERVLSLFPDRKIVQLPQSIHFADAANLERAAMTINRHPDFTLLVRDRPSYELAKTHFSCEVELCPDMAFCLGPQPWKRKPAKELIYLMRTDHEQSASGGRGLAAEDWVNEPVSVFELTRRQSIALLPLLGMRALNRNARRDLRYRILARHRVSRGIAQLSSASHVVTDRLHAHILCVLLGLPHTVLDNSYGKVGRFIEMWTRSCPSMKRATSLEVASPEEQLQMVVA